MNLALDSFSFYLMMWNFSVVGILSVFFWEMPLTLKQGTLPPPPPYTQLAHVVSNTVG